MGFTVVEHIKNNNQKTDISGLLSAISKRNASKEEEAEVEHIIGILDEDGSNQKQKDNNR